MKPEITEIQRDKNCRCVEDNFSISDLCLIKGERESEIIFMYYKKPNKFVKIKVAAVYVGLCAQYWVDIHESVTDVNWQWKSRISKIRSELHGFAKIANWKL